jgi:hypothetical protein
MKAWLFKLSSFLFIHYPSALIPAFGGLYACIFHGELQGEASSSVE